ncbi:MAG: DUF1036 domain-containing protein [Rhodobiaceae bacterium]|jgi:uncharacterized membrane protein|nr:DUF1036 domain-containing protein [Rhodobiaceae bacterium]MDG2496485.1 DUF1036 domain-containing protein [Alphaproteobacteria bacterium]
MSAMSGKPLVFLSSLLGLLGLFSLHGAEARVRLCNETSHVLQVAAAYQQGVASKTEGWISVLPGACENGLEDLPDNAQVFTYAKSDAAHAGEGLVFDGSERFCVGADSAKFTVEGRRDCRRRGYVEADFTAVASSSGRQTVTFTEKSDYGRRRALMAGIQRLLSDLQYDIGAIDGFGGARTRDAAAAYKLRYGIRNDPKGRDLLTKLAQTARDEASQRGLTLCNKTDHLVWAAAGMLKADVFETRGWTRVPAKSCAQVFNQTLDDRFYFYYAEAMDEKGKSIVEAGRRKIWSGEQRLCTKPTRFVIRGNENCSQRGFDRHGFVEIDTGTARRWKVNLD